MTTRARVPGKRPGALVAAAVLVALATAGPAAAQTADGDAPETSAAPAATANPNRFSLSAAADGMLFEIQNSKIPANIVVAAAPVSSFASVDSAGSSRAFAGLPYFGPSVQTLPATVNGLSGGLTPPLPPLPGYVESRFPGDPDVREAQGPYVISARSTETTSSAHAGAGASPDAADPSQQAYSTSEVKALPDGSVVSSASAGATGLRLGPLTILDVSAAEKIIETGDGKPTIQSRTDLGSIKVAGFTIGIDQDGFNLLGAPIDVPAAAAFKAVNAALAAANMEIAYIPRKVVKDAATDVTTVTSGSLRVTTVQDVPIQGPTRVVYTYARVAVSSSSVAFGEEPTVSVPELPAVEPPVVENSGVAAPPPLAVGVDVGAAPPALAPVSNDVPLTAGSDAPAVAAPPGQVLRLGGVQSSAPRGDGTLVYLALVLGGAGIFVGQQSFSRFGVRLLMRS
ncbi:MAG: hypothetical protein JWN55_793 [Frankiales bacterium]|nr:hypothetical protein [Frankiales bacterium]